MPKVLAIAYPSWSIIPETGYLLCQAIESQQSDGVWEIGGERVKAYSDLGQHIYPINEPYTETVP